MRALAVLAALSATGALAGEWVDDCGLQPPGSVPLVPLAPRRGERAVRADESPLVTRVATSHARRLGSPTGGLTGRGALAGKTIYLSPGHGFTWTDLGAAGFDWRTQRPTTNAIVEDLVSIETLDQFLLPLLVGAGAQVFSVREADLNPNLIIVDNGEPGYAEVGSASFEDSTLPAWGRPSFPMDGDTQPFALGTNRLMTTTSAVTATASWTASLPEDGYYDVALSWTAFTARVTDAHFSVRHAGGESHFHVNQQRQGGTWVWLGRYFFRANAPAVVTAMNDSATVGGNVSLDAVRFGGGLGLIQRTGQASGVSGRPRAEESARYHAQFAGAPPSVYAPTANTPGDDRTNDVGTRSRFAAWLHAPGEDAVYLAWHTNAFNASAVGTTTYVYGPNPPDGTYTFTGVAGSDRLAHFVHTELVADLKATSGWNRPTWQDRGVDSAYFGELNPANNSETPAILVEVAFHDAAADAAQLKEPAFRYLATRAMTQGIIKYFAEKDGVPVKLPPEPPERLVAVNQGTGMAMVTWSPGATDAEGVRGQAAISFRVYASADGLSWDDGVAISGTSASFSIPADRPRYFRVTGLNDGGESFPSSIVGVRAPVPGTPLVLVVNAFDRLEAATSPFETFAAHFDLGTVLRQPLQRMNDGSYVRVHGEALDANQVGFDSAEAEAVTAGVVSLEAYSLIDWFTGRGHALGAGPSDPERAALAASRQAGRPVFFSGVADSATQALFGATTASGTGSRAIDGLGPLLGLTALPLDDGQQGTYDVSLSPPSVDPAAGAVQLAAYDSSAGAAVGIEGEAVDFGFPFETLTRRADRVEVMHRVLAFLTPDAGIDAGSAPADAGPAVSVVGYVGCSSSPGLLGALGALLLVFRREVLFAMLMSRRRTIRSTR